MKTIIKFFTLIFVVNVNAAIVSTDVKHWKESTTYIDVDKILGTSTDVKFSWSIRSTNGGFLYAFSPQSVDNTTIARASIRNVCDLKNATSLDFNRLVQPFVEGEILALKNINSDQYVVFQPKIISGSGLDAELEGTLFVETEGTGDFSILPGCH